MIPLRDSAAPRRLTPMNVALIAANLAVFVYEYSLGRQAAALIARYAMVPAEVSASLLLLERARQIAPTTAALWPSLTIFTAMFLHGGLLHVAGNMLYLFVFGAAVENRLGPLRYLWFYFACGIASALATVWIGPASQIPVIGASGAIAGVLGAYFILFPRGRILTVLPIFIFIQFFELPAVVYLLLWFAVQLFSGLSQGATGAIIGGIAWWAHVGGFLFGMVLGPLMAKSQRRRVIDSRGRIIRR
jgi:membrane associated rhomboid family serine protease